MTGPEIMAAVGFFIAVFGFIFGLWKYVDSKLGSVRREGAEAAGAATALASLAREELAAHKLHVAETYVSKAGHRESTEQIMEAISGVKSAVDAMTLRIDRVVEGQPKARTTRSG
ncbi:hypothetical protein SAMN03159496_04615 [Rhizobium sp. NFR07]|uniref:hypothetical protein n=1 Tax=Rhizobium sp. NFR07 TaxID=1566262 RepID=UPI0008E11D9A|nr:hypothetical protein [Rhizobium sp. NFR07]SFB52184.1 hypothetical protein SAMN03159496_04615 [Rhizobium sp. NFR07]